MLQTSFIFRTLDPALGRVDKSSLSQHTLMELMLEKAYLNGDYISPGTKDPWQKDCTEWRGVMTNERNEIREFIWGYCRIGGSIRLEWMPETVVVAVFPINNLEGTVCLTRLPDGLEKLSVELNRLSGTIDVTRLPPRMKQLQLNNNNFEGETDFSQLPESLDEFWVSKNPKLSGVLYARTRRYHAFQSQVRLVKDE